MISPMDTEIDEPTEARVLSSFFFYFNEIKSRVLTFSRARYLYNLNAFPAYEVGMARIRGFSLVLLIVRY